MDKRELRIGNVVGATIAGDIHGNLSPYSIGSGRDIDNAEWFFHLPLTEELLVRFRFEKIVTHGVEFVKYSKYKNFEIEVSLFVLDGKLVTGDDFEISYVHQLQNLYFALTGEGLVLASAEGGGEK